MFVAHRETLEMLRTALSHRAQLATGVFHESLSPARRDIEVAQFRRPEGPSLLVSTECGGEGRNFEFCHRLVLFDLPWNPVVVEQRIGRLDRIGRRLPVEIVYFRPPGGIGAEVVRLLRSDRPLPRAAGGARAGAGARRDRPGCGRAGARRRSLAADAFEALVTEASAARARIRAAAYRELHRDRYRRGAGGGHPRARPAPTWTRSTRTWSWPPARGSASRSSASAASAPSRSSFGNEALVDSLPGVPGGSSFLGTFDREEAVEDETVDFFASGHPLVEGVLAHLEESPLGRVAVLHVGLGGAAGFGLLALYKDGPVFDAVVIDADGHPRPDWAAALARRPLRSRRVPAERMRDPNWALSSTGSRTVSIARDRRWPSPPS